MTSVGNVGRKMALGLFALLATAAMAHAHVGDLDVSNAWKAWSTEPNLVGPIVFLGWAYGVGWLRVRARSPSTPRKGDLGWFVAGWSALTLALISPIHPLGSVLFSVHMIQHELLMVVAAPLLVLGRTELYLLCALPATAGARATRLTRDFGLAYLWRGINRPLVAWSLHAGALWAWHMPRWFEATLSSPWIHTAQHISFLGTAVIFWQAVFRSPKRRAAYGASILYLFTTGIHTGALGALLTFTTNVWYPVYAPTTPVWGLTPLEDQQLGGLIMWVPAGLIYVVAGLALFTSWLRESDRMSAVATAGFYSAKLDLPVTTR